VVFEEFGFAEAHAEVADEEPDGDAGVMDTGFSAHDARGFVDTVPRDFEAVRKKMDEAGFLVSGE
jgi:hypothetical protein